jgi:hypothetical protein
MDKYTKGILTVIAVGIIGLNVQMMNGGGFFNKAHAASDCGSSFEPCHVYVDGGSVNVNGMVMTMPVN